MTWPALALPGPIVNRSCTIADSAHVLALPGPLPGLQLRVKTRQTELCTARSTMASLTHRFELSDAVNRTHCHRHRRTHHGAQHQSHALGVRTVLRALSVAHDHTQYQ